MATADGLVFGAAEILWRHDSPIWCVCFDLDTLATWQGLAAAHATAYCGRDLRTSRQTRLHLLFRHGRLLQQAHAVERDGSPDEVH